jgi:hypothetical protein
MLIFEVKKLRLRSSAGRNKMRHVSAGHRAFLPKQNAAETKCAMLIAQACPV